jgi:hypothetical protein
MKDPRILLTTVSIMPILASSNDRTPFVIEFLNNMRKNPSGLSAKAIAETYHELIPSISAQFNLGAWNREGLTNVNGTQTSLRRNDQSTMRTDLVAIEGPNLAEFLNHGTSLGLQQHVDIILGKLIDDSRAYKLFEFGAFALPFLKTLTATLGKTDGACHKGRYAHIFHRLLLGYQHQYIRKMPTTPKDWRRDPVKCKLYDLEKKCYKECDHCRQLDLFLTHPNESNRRIRIPANQHDHVLNRLERVAECWAECLQLDRFWVIDFTKTRENYEGNM